MDRCAQKPKSDDFGRTYEVLRWIGSGGSPITCAWPCSGNCPLDREDAAHEGESGECDG